MTICQWYTAKNERVDCRIGPRQTREEFYVWDLPKEIQGPLAIEAALYFSQVPTSVGEYPALPEDEYEPIPVNRFIAEVGVR